MRTEFLSFAPPFIDESEIDLVTSVLRSGWLARGPMTGRFEEEFGSYLGAPSALALNSGTAGLHLALLTLGIGPGDEVIVPTMTFCASANVVEHVGARPILVDVESDTLNMDPAAVAAAVTERTRAIMAVHYGGHSVEMGALLEIADRHGLELIEDAAHALPAAFEDSMVGSSGRLTSFSFYATKNLTTGEGGMLTGAPELIEKARVLSLHGMSANAWNRYAAGAPWYYEVVAPGYKYNMSDVQAAIGSAQLQKLDTMQRRRREIVDRYSEVLGDMPELELPRARGHVSPAWHLYPVRVAPDLVRGGRDGFIERMTALNIGTSVHFIPLHLHPFYREKYGLLQQDYPVAQAAFERLVSLPLHPGLADSDIDDVAQAVRLAARGG